MSEKMNKPDKKGKKIISFPDFKHKRAGKKQPNKPLEEIHPENGTSALRMTMRQITRYLNARLRKRNISWAMIPAIYVLQFATRDRLKQIQETFESTENHNLPLHPTLLKEFLDLRRNFVAAIVYQIAVVISRIKPEDKLRIEESIDRMQYLAEQKEWDWMSFHEEEYEFFRLMGDLSTDRTAAYLINRFKQYYLLSSTSLNKNFWNMNQALDAYHDTVALIFEGNADKAEKRIRSFFETNDTKVITYYDSLQSLNRLKVKPEGNIVYGGRYLLLSSDDYMPLIQAAFEEDRAFDDVTTLAIFDKPQKKTARIITRQPGILAGIEIAREAFLFLDFDLKVSLEKKDGDALTPGDCVLKVSGNIQSILRAERIALNFIALLSGIATQTSLFVKEAAKFSVGVLDTRKTLPGYRDLSKYAVAIGGAFNHRRDLAVMGMLKDNHIAAAGSIKEAIVKFKKANPGIPLEVEVDHPDQLYEALEAGPDMVLLDNMTNVQLKKSVTMIREHNKKQNAAIVSEASGGFTLQNLDRLSGTQVDYVSIGSLTSRIEPLDFGLDM